MKNLDDNLLPAYLEGNLCSVHLLLRGAWICGLVQLLVNLLPIQHYCNAVANLPVFQPEGIMLCV